tara:strand:+ start:1326 stop:2399 length:1074 start_codon:yes stop_codon:yes gene_type:complete
MNGSLVYEDYQKLILDKNILGVKSIYNQIQPSSLDLTLSEECYEIKSSFLSSKNKIKDRLADMIVKKIDLDHGAIFNKNKTYLVRLNEKLNLNDNICGLCNPKSSTGRLDIFCRTVLNYCDEYEKIPLNYFGEIFLEITCRSFNIRFQKGDSLNQMRLIFNQNNYLNDTDLIEFNKKNSILFDENNKTIVPYVDNGLKVSVDLSMNNKINAFRANKNAPILLFNKINVHNISDFWTSIKLKENYLLIERDHFYILKSKEKIRIPPNMAGEMVPYDTGIGDFRVHYAGFFDPGFGNPNGSYAVLEVKTNEVPFLLEDGQTIARIKYEKLNKDSRVVYGSDIKSNYQNQGLTLSKHFKK